ncbi:MAG: flagellar hook-associated protein FlgK [Pseudorhodoplanes sp.]|jgi:flagellar hook-associated protein 1 FlgK|nr:flagellar hook-associated protein FlgK [Pseudorhodoplanes sp.]
MSLSQALATSVAGLRITQSSLALVASNVANAETPGYVRKTAAQVTTAAGANGVSVRIASINRELDQYVQRQLRAEVSGGTYATMRAEYYSRIQSIFGEPGADSTLETAFNNFTTSLQALSTSPDSVTARTTTLNLAQVLTQQLNSMSNQIQSLRSDAELGLSDSVARANNAMQQVAAINRQLSSNNAKDAATATLMDQRDAYIDELSHLMDIRVLQGDNNQINIFTGSGIQLVGVDAAQIGFDAQGTVTAEAKWDPDPAKRTVGTLTLTSSTASPMDLIASKSIRSGEMAAYLELRDDILVQAQAQLDQIASAMASSLSSIAMPTTAVAGPPSGFDIDTTGMLPGNVINLTYTDVMSGQQRKVSIIRVDDPEALPLSNDATSDPNDEVIGVDFSGGMAAVATALTSHFNGQVVFSNPAGNTLRIVDDGAGNTSNVDAVGGTRTLTAFNSGTGALPFFTDAGLPFSGAFNSLGPQSLGFAGRISVNSALLSDPSNLVNYQAGTESGDATRPNFIYNQVISASLTYSPSAGIGALNNPFSGSLTSYMRQVIGFQGAAAENATNLAAGQEVVVNALQERFSEAAAVNVDVEMAHLLNLQTAYGANARVMSTVKEMLDTLMNM